MSRFGWLARAFALAFLCASAIAPRLEAATTFIFVNNASTTLAAPANSSATTLTLASATNFPSSIPANSVLPLTLNDAATHLVYEVVYVTAISGTTLTVQRAQEGTTAQNWSAGDFAFSAATAGVMQSFGNVAGPLTSTVGDLPTYSNTSGTGIQDSGASLASAGFTTGDYKLTLKTAADPGWVMMNDGTMGNASSGGTTRANADTQSLFVLLWGVCAQAQCPVSGGRGSSALSDFNANKTIALPKMLGRALAVAGSGSGLTSRALGAAAGAETSTIAQANLPNVNFNVTINDPGHFHNVPNGPPGSGSVAGGGSGNPDSSTRVAFTGLNSSNVIVNSGGSGTAMSTLSPYGFVGNVEIKL